MEGTKRYNTVEPYAKWEVTTNRFVAFLDILNFDQMVVRNTHQETYNILKIITKVKQDLGNVKFNNISSYFYITTFSHYIAIFSKDNSDYPSQYFFSAVSLIFNSVLEQSIPVKGAIAYGNMTVNIDNSIFFGQPLIDAYELQESLYFYGITLHNTAEKQMTLIDSQYKTSTFDVKTILKQGDIEHCNINHYIFLNQSNRSFFKEMMRKIRESVSGESRKYVDNTLEMYNRYYPLKKQRL